MKVLLVAFAICVVAVIGGTKLSDEIDELLKDYHKECIMELKLDPRLINEEENATNPSPQEATCYQACLDKKLGLLSEDGSYYNYDRAKSLAETPEKRDEVEKIFNEKIKDCQAAVVNDPCKLAACVHSMPKELWMKEE